MFLSKYHSMIVIIFLISKLSPVTCETYYPKDFKRHVGLAPVADWEHGLREAAFQALVKERVSLKRLRDKLMEAPLVGKQNKGTPFGDVAILARGQLYLSAGGFRFFQDPYQNDCTDCHDLRRCIGRECDIYVKNRFGERLIALWSVKRIRHRDPDTRFELEYTVSPVRKYTLVTKNGGFNYAIPGHVFVIRTAVQVNANKLINNWAPIPQPPIYNALPLKPSNVYLPQKPFKVPPTKSTEEKRKEFDIYQNLLNVLKEKTSKMPIFATPITIRSQTLKPSTNRPIYTTTQFMKIPLPPGGDITLKVPITQPLTTASEPVKFMVTRPMIGISTIPLLMGTDVQMTKVMKPTIPTELITSATTSQKPKASEPTFSRPTIPTSSKSELIPATNATKSTAAADQTTKETIFGFTTKTTPRFPITVPTLFELPTRGANFDFTTKQSTFYRPITFPSSSTITTINKPVTTMGTTHRMKTMRVVTSPKYPYLPTGIYLPTQGTTGAVFMSPNTETQQIHSTKPIQTIKPWKTTRPFKQPTKPWTTSMPLQTEARPYETTKPFHIITSVKQTMKPWRTTTKPFESTRPLTSLTATDLLTTSKGFTEIVSNALTTTEYNQTQSTLFVPSVGTTGQTVVKPIPTIYIDPTHTGYPPKTTPTTVFTEEPPRFTPSRPDPIYHSSSNIPTFSLFTTTKIPKKKTTTLKLPSTISTASTTFTIQLPTITNKPNKPFIEPEDYNADFDVFPVDNKTTTTEKPSTTTEKIIQEDFLSQDNGYKPHIHKPQASNNFELFDKIPSTTMKTITKVTPANSKEIKEVFDSATLKPKLPATRDESDFDALFGDQTPKTTPAPSVTNKIIYSDFFEASTKPKEEMFPRTTTVPSTSQSFSTSVTFLVGNKRRPTTKVVKKLRKTTRPTVKTVENTGEHRKPKQQNVTMAPLKEEVGTTASSKAAFDELALSLVNHVRSIDYLDGSKAKRAKYKRKNYGRVRKVTKRVTSDARRKPIKS